MWTLAKGLRKIRKRPDSIYSIINSWYEVLILENATLMGPRKQAKDSRKVCERGVPGNFYLARHSYIYNYIYTCRYLLRSHPLQRPVFRFLMDKIYLPFYCRASAKTSVLQCWAPLNPTWIFVSCQAWGFMVRSKASLKEVLDTVDKWQPKGLLPCHGKYQASGDVTWVADGCRKIGDGARKTGHPIAMQHVHDLEFAVF